MAKTNHDNVRIMQESKINALEKDLERLVLNAMEKKGNVAEWEWLEIYLVVS